METMLADFIWLRPQWLWCLLPALAFAWWCPRSLNEGNPWSRVCDPALLRVLTKQPNQPQGGNWARILMLLSLFIIILALAGPSWKEQRQTVYQQQRTLVVALDLSAAMMDDDLPPSRLVRAKYKLTDLFKQFKEGQIGLIAYTKQAFVASPLTTDNKTLLALLPALQFQIMPVRGSDVSAALAEAQRLIQQSQISEGQILVVSASHVPREALKLAQTLRQQNNILTHVYALRQDAAYAQLAQAGGGIMQVFRHDESDIQQLLQAIEHASQQQAKQTQQLWTVRIDQGPDLLWLLLPIALLMFRRGWLEEALR